MAKAKKTIDFVRHPDKDGDAQNLYLGNDARITEKGKLEAELLVERLSQVPHQIVVSSLLPRALDLAQGCAKRFGVPLVTCPWLNEIDKPQSLVGLSRTDPVHVETMERIRACFDEGTTPEGIEVKNRFEIEDETRRALNFLAAPGIMIEGLPFVCDSILVVTHAKRIASIIHWILTGSLVGFYRANPRIRLDTTGITTIAQETDPLSKETIWRVTRINDMSHHEDSSAEIQELLAELRKLG